MTYRVRGTRAINPADAQAYREFADWTARLQSRVKLGAPPPFPRLYVNGDLERRGLRPDEVELTFKTAKTKSSVLRSTHKYESKLYSDDLKQIADADGYASSFQAVSTEEYLLPPPRQARR
jgi:hypothetical protein